MWCWLLWYPPTVHAGATSIERVEQQISLVNGEYSTSNTTDSPTNNSLGLSAFDPDEYTSPTVYFEVVGRCDSCSGGNAQMTASLYNESGVVQVTVPVTGTSFDRYRSNTLILPEGKYTVRFKLDATGGTAYLKGARLLIFQSGTALTDTTTQVEVGGIDTTDSTSALSLEAPKYYVYDHDQFSGTINAYFEATLRTNANNATATYRFDGYDTVEAWSTNPANMVDGSTATFASTDTAQTQRLNANTSNVANLGIISKVEVRAYSYQDNGSGGQVTVRPVYSGGDGNNHNYNPPGTAAYSDWMDITSDTNAPTSWSWTDLENLDLDLDWTPGGAGNTGYVANVQLRVTYEDPAILAYAELYNRTNNQVVGNSTISTSSNTYQLIRSSALSSNWDTSNDDEYEVRIYTNSVTNAVYLVNAKIVLDQYDADNLDKVEVVHHMIVAERTTTNTDYTQESFLLTYDPDNWYYANTHRVFFESTLKTSGGTGFVALYNITDTDIIESPNTSELTTTSASYERKRSNNLSYNSDWSNLADRKFATILKATSTQTVYVSSSTLIIQAQAQPPAFTFTISGVGTGETNNGVTTSAATTITSLPFGNVSVNAPKFLTHQLTVTANDPVRKWYVYLRLRDPLQGLYPSNYIDSFIGSGATWSSPQAWISPTGTVPNQDTAWFGANTSDTTVPGWSSGSGLFGPVTDTAVEVMRGASPATSKTVHVSFAIEANQLQPPDAYAGTIEYRVLPEF